MTAQMKLLLISLIPILLWTQMCRGQSISDPARIDVYVTPYYNSIGPAINVGAFSKGLGASDESEFLETISKMRTSWGSLKFTELYVAAIRLYDRGFRNEAVYWFYSAQYHGKLVAALLDRQNLGSIGDPGFEMEQAQNAFHQLVGPYINGYAFGNVDRLLTVIEKVQKEGKTIPDLKKIYPGLTFKRKSEWEMANKKVNEGLAELAKTVNEQRTSIKEQRAQNGTEAKFSKLTSRELTLGR